MRLADVDKILKDLENNPNLDFSMCDACWGEIYTTIDNAPIIAKCGISSEGLPLMDLRPKPTGEWEIVDAEGGKIWNCVCTECGHDPQEYIGGTDDWWLTKSHLPNFCPNCGVKIVNVKGGKEE